MSASETKPAVVPEPSRTSYDWSGLRPYAQLVRLPNTFTAMADICLGALAAGILLERWPVFVCLLVASTLLYWSGMVWNDYFDLEQDRKERPGRPLASG